MHRTEVSSMRPDDCTASRTSRFASFSRGILQQGQQAKLRQRMDGDVMQLRNLGSMRKQSNGAAGDRCWRKWSRLGQPSN